MPVNEENKIINVAQAKDGKQKVSVKAPFELAIVSAFANAVNKEGGTFYKTDNNELAIRYLDGRVVIFEGSSEIPKMTTEEMIIAYNNDPSSLIAAFSRHVSARPEDGSEGSNGNFYTDLVDGITVPETTADKVPVGRDIDHLPGQIGSKYGFALNLDLLFNYFKNQVIEAGVGRSEEHLPGLPDEDFTRGRDLRDDLGADDEGGNNVPPSFAIADQYEALEGETVTGNLLDNDVYPNGFAEVQLVTAPNAGTVTINPDGTFEWVPPPHFSGEVTFEYSFIDAITGEAAIASVTVTVTAVVDEPLLLAPDFTGDEDTPVDLAALDVALQDTDGSETLDIQISNVPAGASFNGGTDLGGGVWSFSQAEFDTLQYIPPLHEHGTTTLTLTATSRETSTGETSTISENFDITIEADADAPTVTTGTTVVDEENFGAFGPDISYGLVDSDGSEVISQIEIGAIPAGAAVNFVAIGGAVVTPVGTTGFTITGTEAEIRATLDTFEIKPPLHSATDFDLTVAVTTTDADGSTATTNDTHRIEVAALADAPTVNTGTTPVDEDTMTVFGTDITYALVDTDGSEVISQVEIGDIPAGATVNFTLSGSAVVTPVGTTGFTITGTEAEIRATLDTFAIQPPLHSNVDFDLTVAVTTTDTGGDTATTTETHTIDVEAEADAPTVTTGTTPVDEDTMTVFGTDITYALVDADGSEVISEVEIGAIPAGATVNFTPSGAAVVTPVGATGFTITGTEAEIRATLDTFAIQPPAHSDTDFDLTVAVTTTDADGSTATSNDTHTIDVEAEADAPTVTTGTTPVDEDTMTVFGTDITYALVDADGSEVISEVEIGAIPAGATVNFTPSGAAVVTPVGATGFTITGTEAEIRATLDTFAIQPPAHSDTDFDLTVAVTTTDADGSTATSNDTHTIDVEAEADAPTVTTGTTPVDEDTMTVFGTDITYALVDADGSEVISEVEIGAIPAGATVNFTPSGAAVVTPVGATGFTITGTEAEIRATLDTFAIQPPAHSDTDFDLTVAVTTTDADGSTATSNDTHTIDVEAEADAPTVTTGTTPVDEDTMTVFGTDITYALVDADGSEVISEVEIGAIPAGATVNFTPSGAAVVTPVGATGFTITGTEAEIRATLDTFAIQPPAHSDTDFDLTVAVTTTDADGSTATSNDTHTIDVEAEADAPTVTTGTTPVDEDTMTVFGTDITYALVDADGSEVISEVEIGAIPAGATVNFTPSGAAVVTPVGATGFTITGTEAEIRATLDTFAIQPPADSDVDFDLTIGVTTTDADGSTATSNDTHTINVAAVADAPSGSGSAVGSEDTAIATPITVSLSDTDGSETLDFVSVTAPAGVTLGGFGGSGATVNQVGQTWTFTGTDAQIQAALTALTTTPPADSDVDITLAVVVQSIESTLSGGQVTTATAQDTFNVGIVVQAVADTPNATGGTYNTDEDTAVALVGITGALSDTDGSETLSFQITGVDPDASFNVGTDLGGGVWAFTQAQIAGGISYTPPPQEHGTFTMTLEAIATEVAVGGQVAVKTAVGTSPIEVTVAAVLDAPVLNNGSTTGNEDTTLNVGSDIDLSLVDVDGSQTMQITLTGIPVTASVAWNGGLPGTVTNPVAGTFVISGTAQEAMDLLDSLTVTPGAHNDGNFTVNVSVYTEETSTGDNTTVNATHDVTVSAVADAPNLASAGGTGNEDTVIAIPVTTGLVDTDGTERLDFVDISGVPAGATLGWNGALPGSVVNTAPGTFRFSGTETEIQNLLATLTIQPGLHSGDDFTLTATAQTTEFNPTEVGDIAVATATSNININVDVVPVADQPSVSVGAGAFAGEEDTMIPLTGFGGALVDVDGSETLTFRVDSVPAGASFSSGTNLGGGVWEFTAAQITAGISFQAPLNLHGTFNMNLTSIATEGENNDQATNTLPFSVVVDAQADAPVIAINASGDEDTNINFGSQIAVTLFDSDGSESITSITVDATAFATPPTFSAVGAAVVTPVGQVYTITGTEADIQATLDTFSVTPPAHSDVDIPVTVSANTIDADGSTNSVSVNGNIIVRAVADTPTSNAVNANGTEDQWFSLSGLVAGASADVDGSETISAVLTNLPAGTEVRVVGVPGATVTQQGNDWLIEAPDLVTLNAALASSEMMGPEHFSGTFTATLDVISTEAANGAQVSVKTATASSNFDITIGAVADAPVIVVTPSTNGAAGFEDTPIPLSINVDNVDNDGSEDLVIQISGIPVGATLSAGTDLGGGVFELTQAQLAGLTITPPLHSNDDFQLTVTATSTENTPGIPGDGDSQLSSTTLDVEVIGVADAPGVASAVVVSNEDQPIPLGAGIVGNLVDTDGSETLAFIVSGLPAGVVPSTGTFIGGGQWQIDAADMATLTIPAPANFSGDYVTDFAPGLTVRAVSQENDGDQAFTDVPLAIFIDPVIDTVSNGTGVEVTEDNNISLAGAGVSSFADNDGSETVVSYTFDFNTIVADAQIGAIVADANDFITNFVNGTFVDNGNGTITVAAADLAGINLDASAFLDSNIDFSIPVETLVQDQAGATIVNNTFNSNFAVDLVGDADIPTVFAQDVTGNSGNILDVAPTNTEFGGDTTDTDSSALGRPDSEDIYYIVSGVLDEPGILMAFVNSAGDIVGLNNNDGTWLLSPADLADLNILTAGGSSGTVTLTLTTVAVENDGDLATNSTTFDLTVSTGGGGGPGPVAPLPPILTINAMPTNEDGAVVLNVTATPDPGDPSPTPPTVNVVIRGVPAGAEVTGASYNPTNDTWVAPASVVNGGGVTILPPEDFSGTMNVTVEAIATNENLLTASTGVQNAPVDVAPVADGPDISITSPGGDEDTAIALNIGVSLIDQNGTLNETINEPITVTVSDGATLSAGTDLGGGVYELTLAQLAGLTVTPALNFSGSIGVSVSASTTEPGNGDTQVSVANGSVAVTAVADAPNVSAANSTGDEDTAIALGGLSTSLVDADGSELLSAKISGLPEGTILSAGSNNGDGSWTVNPADLATLTLTPPLNYSGTLSLTLEAFSLDDGGDTATASTNFDVIVNPQGDDVLMTLLPKSGDEGTEIDLDLGVTLGDDTGGLAGENPGETVEITFTGVTPGGVGLLANGGGTLVDQGAGTWVFTGTQAEANGIAVVSTSQEGTVTIGVSARANDNGDLGTPGVGSIDVTFNAVSDQTLTGNGGSNTLTGGAGDDTISGLGGIDILSGGSGDDTILGGGGGDTITGGLGADTLTGGGGADTFVYGTNDPLAGNVDTINDFNTGQNDALDLSALLPGYTPGVDTLTDFINLSEGGGDTTVQIDPTGTGTFNTDVVVLSGVTGLDVNTMETNNHLIV